MVHCFLSTLCYRGKIASEKQLRRGCLGRYQADTLKPVTHPSDFKVITVSTLHTALLVHCLKAMEI